MQLGHQRLVQELSFGVVVVELLLGYVEIVGGVRSIVLRTVPGK